MDALPKEILIQILENLPSSALKQARLTSRTFNNILAKHTFKVLVSFLDSKVAQSTLLAVAYNPERRWKQPSIWSPRCSVPQNLRINETFLMALWAGLRGDSWIVETGTDRKKLDIGTWQKGVERDINEKELSEVMFRYNLYLSYARG